MIPASLGHGKLLKGPVRRNVTFSVITVDDHLESHGGIGKEMAATAMAGQRQ